MQAQAVEMSSWVRSSRTGVAPLARLSVCAGSAASDADGRSVPATRCTEVAPPPPPAAAAAVPAAAAPHSQPPSRRRWWTRNFSALAAGGRTPMDRLCAGAKT